MMGYKLSQMTWHSMVIEKVTGNAKCFEFDPLMAYEPERDVTQTYPPELSANISKMR